MRTAQDLLAELNASDESPRIEAKRAREIGKSIMETVIAFANEPGLGGGYLLLGVDWAVDAKGDTRYWAVGIPDPDKVQKDLATQCASMLNVAVRPEMAVERVSWLCRDTRKDNEGDGSCELIFSNRSAMSYEDLRNYLLHLKDKPGTDARIDWNAIRPQQVRAVNHDQLAGLQMADAVASSLFFAVNLTQYSEVEDRYFRMLRPTIYRHPKTGELGYGLRFWPGSLEALTEDMAHLANFSPPK